ncbi:MAG: DNA-binding protein [Cyanobacteria bacterium J06631_9]
MAAITIELPDHQFQALQALADRQGIPLEVLLRSSLESWTTFQASDFVEAADYVLAKNRKLYQRLA